MPLSLNSSGKRPSFANFPIPFDHPYTLPTLLVTVTVSSLAYYYLQATHAADLVEAVRLRDIHRRRVLKRPEERYASLKVGRHFANPFIEWQPVSWWRTAVLWTQWYCSIYYHSSNHSNHTTTTTTNSSSSKVKQQSTCLVTLEGIGLLTDPVFSSSIGNTCLGPKRLRPPPCSLEDIKDHIDIVLISHNHFDHLDEKVVDTLGNSVTWYIPLGLRDWFVNKGIDNVIELDWWQEIHPKECPSLTIACVPAMNQTYTHRNNKQCLSGDSGYVPDLFKAIGDLYGPFCLAALPIGHYEPEEYIKSHHMGPMEAIQAHMDLGRPKISVGIHWGTFRFSEESCLEPSILLKKAWKKRQLSGQDRLVTTAVGETLDLV
ncbi:beta-lactamase superfamily domain-containing protein [Spinellus fusiger]|nr:beta-lactamase superfamily domain-containing protein [Spinellus fusiger]